MKPVIKIILAAFVVVVAFLSLAWHHSFFPFANRGESADVAENSSADSGGGTDVSDIFPTLGQEGGERRELKLAYTLDDEDFTDPSTNYQSTARLELSLPGDGGGRPFVEPVRWSVETVANNSKAWNRAAGARNGLSWGGAANGGASPGEDFWQDDAVRGEPPTTGSAMLTDVVGERTVRVAASTAIDGVIYSGAIDVAFGPGPLSIFTKPPVVSKSWARSSAPGSGGFGNLNESGPADFPAAAEVCGGRVGVSGVAFGTAGSEPTFDTGPDSGWERAPILDGNHPTSFHADSALLPTMEQLLAVSFDATSAGSRAPRTGAALAAGWPPTFGGGKAGRHLYWTGDVSYGDGGLQALLVDLRDGKAEYRPLDTPGQGVACVAQNLTGRGIKHPPAAGKPAAAGKPGPAESVVKADSPSLVEVRDLLSAKPRKSLAEMEEVLGRIDGVEGGEEAVFLLVRAMAREDPRRHVRLGAFFDPLDERPKGGVAPNVMYAYEEYVQAGDVDEAGRRKDALADWTRGPGRTALGVEGVAELTEVLNGMVE
ncbi:MAG: hypothetical protein LBP95_04240 [Deltaproteobacteria bacterium]|jgi:hypothetical protein|nr:hypothetical protein [Deltaproteobacteria bacterium]